MANSPICPNCNEPVDGCIKTYNTDNKKYQREYSWILARNFCPQCGTSLKEVIFRDA